jgi:hypothetical protein
VEVGVQPACVDLDVSCATGVVAILRRRSQQAGAPSASIFGIGNDQSFNPLSATSAS